jgi:hypothetical protein
MNQLKEGIRAEREHADVIKFIEDFHGKHGRFPSKNEIYKRIAKGHLREDPQYYAKLKKYNL